MLSRLPIVEENGAYRHRITGRIYVVDCVATSKIKRTGVEEVDDGAKLVVYHSVETGRDYVRPIQAFVDRFDRYHGG